MRVSKDAVVSAASGLADEKGLQGVSLKEVAGRLGIRTPSLYNHIGCLEDLLLEVAHRGMRAMNDRMSKTAIGKSGDNALQAASIEYLNSVVEHPGVYETIQWATWHGNDETAGIFADYVELLTTLIRSCDLKSPRMDEIVALLTGLLHGYATFNVREDPDKAKASLTGALDTVLAGIRQKYG
jgi:AcrR family transcriptional regulator